MTYVAAESRRSRTGISKVLVAMLAMSMMVLSACTPAAVPSGTATTGDAAANAPAVASQTGAGTQR